MTREADGIVSLMLVDANGRPLPGWTAGAHIELVHGGFERKYSLCGRPGDAAYGVAILRDAGGRGGSRHFHDAVGAGDELLMRGPRSHFRLNEAARHHVLIAGGIGITPILAWPTGSSATARALTSTVPAGGAPAWRLFSD
jgi:ferredoxin-NADP reductase